MRLPSRFVWSVSFLHLEIKDVERLTRIPLIETPLFSLKSVQMNQQARGVAALM